MAERPILMSAPMVRALLEHRKTQTRRIVKGQPLWLHTQVTPAPPHGPFYLDENAVLHCKYISAGEAWFKDGMNRCAVLSDQGRLVRCPYGKPGDRLWVRETFYLDADQVNGIPFNPQNYRATRTCGDNPTGWRSAIFMCRIISRITLEITEVRVQRLQEISKADVLAEGCTERDGAPLADCVAGWHEPYASLWESINGAGSWDVNPWVWAVSFKGIA